ncbi:MAG: hypothetical protein AzoDbin1_05136 [Azoarcus sp.]|nr:hypothetical protein [Azoarcus sp.]
MGEGPTPIAHRERLWPPPPVQSLRYVGRPRSAAPAVGSYALHQAQQQALVDDALAPAQAAAARKQKSA